MYTCKVCNKEIVGVAYIPPCKNIVHIECVIKKDPSQHKNV